MDEVKGLEERAISVEDRARAYWALDKLEDSCANPAPLLLYRR